MSERDPDRVLARALGQALGAGPRPAEPRSVRGARAYFADNRELTLTLMRRKTLPKAGTPARRRYDNLLRSVQRYQKVGGQTRGTSKRAVLTKRAVAAARPRWLRRLQEWRRARRRGFLMRWRAELRVSKVWRIHTMPAEVAGSSRYQPIGPELAQGVVDTYERGEHDEAGDELADAFLDAYGLPGADWRDPEWAEVRVQ